MLGNGRNLAIRCARSRRSLESGWKRLGCRLTLCPTWRGTSNLELRFSGYRLVYRVVEEHVVVVVVSVGKRERGAA